jgi:hypothetical protein
MKFFRRLRRLTRWAAVGLTVAAISQEMNKAPADRTWTGKVFGVVPYDFRPPTWERLRDAFWNPDDPRLFTERPLGVGWAVNLFRAQLLMRGAFESLMGDESPEPVQRKRSERKASARP